MTTKAVALLSGGLDSILAIRILQEQGVEVEAINFQTIFTCCRDNAAQAAHELGVRLTVIGQEDDYIELIRRPRYGYGKGANPCVDCRIYMFERGKKFMEEVGASMVVSGEVLGQRPKSQKRRDLAIIAQQSGITDRLLRPLSAKLLPPTLPERLGEVDRQRLYAFSGRSRKGLIALAKYFGLRTIPSPSTGCSLTERSFAPKVHDLVQIDTESGRWDFELLNVGRHLRIDSQTKAVVGRDAAENESLRQMVRDENSRATAILTPENFAGPTVMLIGPPIERSLNTAAGLVLRFCKQYDLENAIVNVETGGEMRQVLAVSCETANELATL